MAMRHPLYEIAQYFIENKSTVRKTANHFGIGKTNIHTKLTKELPRVFPDTYESVKQVLEQNKAEAPHRGGQAVQQKYRELKVKEE